MDKIKKLSDAIELGSEHLSETKVWTKNSTPHAGPSFICGACAIGTGIVFVNGGRWPKGVCECDTDAICAYVEKRFNVPLNEVKTISSLHYTQHLTRAQAIARLREKGL